MFDKRCACYAVRLFISTEGCSESVVAYKDLREFVEAAGEERGTEAHLGGGRSGAGDHRDYRARDARRRPGVAFRASQRLASSPAHQCAGQRAAHSIWRWRVDSFEEVAERIRGFLDMQAPQGLLDKIKMLPKLAELGSFFPKTVKTGPCKEVIRARRIFAAGVPDFAMLAAGCGAIHHLAAGDHAQSGDRKAQRGRLSHAGV